MNKFMGMLAAAVLCAGAWAGDYAELVPENADGAVCLYPSVFMASEFGKAVLAQGENQAKSLGMDAKEMEEKTGFNPERDLQRLTVAVVKAQEEEFYMVAEGKFDVKKIEEAVAAKNFKDYKAQDRNGFRQLSFIAEEKAQPIFLALSAEKTLMAPSEAALDGGVNVVTGKAKNAKGVALFANKAAEGTGKLFVECVFDVAKQVNTAQGVPPQMDDLKNINAAALFLTEQPDKKLALTVDLLMNDAASATKLKQMAEGFLKMFGAQLPVAQQVKLAAKESRLTAVLALSMDEIKDLTKMAAGSVMGADVDAAGDDDDDDE